MIDLCAGLPVANCAGGLLAKYDPTVFGVLVVVVAGHARTRPMLCNAAMFVCPYATSIEGINIEPLLPFGSTYFRFCGNTTMAF